MIVRYVPAYSARLLANELMALIDSAMSSVTRRHGDFSVVMSFPNYITSDKRGDTIFAL